MSSVFSKLINRASARYGIRQETLTRGIFGSALALYALKLGYPYLAASIKRQLAIIRQRKGQRGCQRDKRNGAARGTSNDDEVALLPEDAAGSARGKPLVGLDRAFLRQLLMLLRIMVPGWRSRETGLLACATLTLLARTFLSVYVAELEGQLVKRIVLRDVRGFSHMLARWFAIALPATFVNSAIRYLEGRLALSFRYDSRRSGCTRWSFGARSANGPRSLCLSFLLFFLSCSSFSSSYASSSLFPSLLLPHLLLSFASPSSCCFRFFFFFTCSSSVAAKYRNLFATVASVFKRRRIWKGLSFVQRERDGKRVKDAERTTEVNRSIRLCSLQSFGVQNETIYLEQNRSKIRRKLDDCQRSGALGSPKSVSYVVKITYQL